MAQTQKLIKHTIIKDRDDYRFIKFFDETGYATEHGRITNLGYYEAHCKHCDYIQHGNPNYDIIAHLKAAHNIDYKN